MCILPVHVCARYVPVCVLQYIPVCMLHTCVYATYLCACYVPVCMLHTCVNAIVPLICNFTLAHMCRLQVVLKITNSRSMALIFFVVFVWDAQCTLMNKTSSLISNYAYKRVLHLYATWVCVT